jgi:hypothetical protein
MIVLSACGSGSERESVASNADDAALVVVFVSRDCPATESYAPEIRFLSEEFVPRGIAFNVVYLDQRLTRDAAVEHAAAHIGPLCDVVVDSNRYLARLVQTTVTPEVVVTSREGEVLYRGRIDDTWIDANVSNVDPTTRDLRDALVAILDGREIENPLTDAIGSLLADEGDGE